MPPEDSNPAPDSTTPCEVCGATSGHRLHVATERMFGRGGEFTYRECGGCGCLQLLNVPTELGAYYPDDYYSLTETSAVRRPWWDLQLRRQRAWHELTGKNLLGKLLPRGAESPLHYRWMRRLGLTPHNSILDVGCGTGWLLHLLYNEGFTSVIGIDPYVERDLEFPNGVRVLKRELPEMDGTFDLVVLGHSFEHMAQPERVLQDLRRLVAPGRSALLRIPVADSWAWRHYGVHWVQLDAPRHLFLHTRRSIQLLASRTGFELEHVECDSTEFQFTGSEAYLRGLTLNQMLAADPFTAAEHHDFQQRAAELNQEGLGDQAAFYLRAV